VRRSVRELVERGVASLQLLQCRSETRLLLEQRTLHRRELGVHRLELLRHLLEARIGRMFDQPHDVIIGRPRETERARLEESGRTAKDELPPR
jgi:hypothetical protein